MLFPTKFLSFFLFVCKMLLVLRAFTATANLEKAGVWVLLPRKETPLITAEKGDCADTEKGDSADILCLCISRNRLLFLQVFISWNQVKVWDPDPHCTVPLVRRVAYSTGMTPKWCGSLVLVSWDQLVAEVHRWICFPWHPSAKRLRVSALDFSGY